MLFPKRRKITSTPQKRESFSNWRKCGECQELIYRDQIAVNCHCCPHCNFHYSMGSKDRIALLADQNTFCEYFAELQPLDTLGFTDTQSYPSRLANARRVSGQNEAICLGTCSIYNRPVVLGALDFSFMAGSMGSVVGEKIALGAELAAKLGIGIILVSTSGGARMQEAIFSLMQMAKVAVALSRLDRLCLPYISILTNPTCGGVTASFAALGDVIIAEPNALICFAGPRIVEQTAKQKLPKGAQRSEFLLEIGMIDCVSSRQNLKKMVGKYLFHLQPKQIDLHREN